MRPAFTMASEVTAASVTAHTLSGLAQSLQSGVTGDPASTGSSGGEGGRGWWRAVAAWWARCRLVSRDSGVSPREKGSNFAQAWSHC